MNIGLWEPEGKLRLGEVKEGLLERALTLYVTVK